jgi:anti-sigma regulatory factor (Ser/Thr protein kinase)
MATRRSSHSLELCNDLSELTRLSEWLRATGGQMKLPDEVLSDVDHCAAEAVHNIIAYAYPDTDAHVIQVRLSREPDRLNLEIEDDGTPFNPLEYPAPLPVSRIEHAPLGGRGIRIVRGLMTECSYRRENGKNILTMVRAWAAHGQTP